jgi:CheY-like chemotaxis protein
MDTAMLIVCRDAFPTCGKYYLTPFAKSDIRFGVKLRGQLATIPRGWFMTGKTRILVVEDEPGVSMMMAYLLTQAGCEVQTAWNAKRGMKLAQTQDFDLITLDATLPGISGFEICRRLTENPFFQTPIIFVSGQSCDQDVQYGLELGDRKSVV